MLDNKVSFQLSPEQAERIAELKRTKFFDKPYADLYRYLLDIALSKEEEKE